MLRNNVPAFSNKITPKSLRNSKQALAHDLNLIMKQRHQW
jgi:hypothetical protein